MKITSIILAAGQGVRMKSDLPKVLHPIAGQTMIQYALDSAVAVSNEKPVVVIGQGAAKVQKAIGSQAECVLQAEQLGTGHAVQQAQALLEGKTDLVLVTYADMPLLRSETLQKLVDFQLSNPGPLSLLTIISQDKRGFGRIVRNLDGSVQAIVEEAVASPQQLQIDELNVGAYCFSASWLWNTLAGIKVSPKGEYYLTDTVAAATGAGLPVLPLQISDLDETIGVNTRLHLAAAESAMRKRINQSHMLAGVTLVDPFTTYIDTGVEIGSDTVIWPNTYLHSGTHIGRHCNIGPNTIIRNSTIADHCQVLASVLEGAVLDEHVDMGPFARLRKGAHLGKGVHMGNFGEVKDSFLGEGTKMGHFSYIGNATIGTNVNIGAGTITCNFDGEKKLHTEIEDDVFIGSDSMLVAPLKIGKHARTGAGAVVTKDVAPDTLVVGMPARAIRKLEMKKDD